MSALSTHDTVDTLAPVCPHCGHEMTTDEMLGHDDDLFALAPNEGRTSVECPACSQTFHVQGGYRPEYTTAIDEDDL